VSNQLSLSTVCLSWRWYCCTTMGPRTCGAGTPHHNTSRGNKGTSESNAAQQSFMIKSLPTIGSQRRSQVTCQVSGTVLTVRRQQVCPTEAEQCCRLCKSSTIPCASHSSPALRSRCTTHLQVPHCLSIPWQLLSLVINQPHVTEDVRTPLSNLCTHSRPCFARTRCIPRLVNLYQG
jgi:hypothetical protein